MRGTLQGQHTPQLASICDTATNIRQKVILHAVQSRRLSIPHHACVRKILYTICQLAVGRAGLRNVDNTRVSSAKYDAVRRGRRVSQAG